MRFVAEPISNLRLTRFHRWAMLWLQWFAAFLEGAAALAPLSRQAEAVGHRWLDRIERIIFAIVMLRPAPRVRRLAVRKGIPEHRLSRGSLRRAVLGARLRRALRPKHLSQRIEALTQRIDVLVEHLLRRLPRGLTRRRPIVAIAKRGSVVALSATRAPALAADTS